MIIVTGLPRSGTSLLMQCLFHLGIETLSEKVSGTWNKKGYFESSFTLEGINTSDYGLNLATKIILYPLMSYSKLSSKDKIIFCLRNPHQVAYSQINHAGYDNFDQNMIHYYENYQKFKDWLSYNKNLNFLFVDYDDMLMDSMNQINRISKFLEISFEEEKINTCIRNIDKHPAYDLYREFYEFSEKLQF